MKDKELYEAAKLLTIPLGIKVKATDIDIAEAIFVRGAKWALKQIKKESS